MSENVIIINTHTSDNPMFVGKLVESMKLFGISPEIMDGYGKENPLDHHPSHILLTGVPIDVDYSLSEEKTQEVVHRAFGWLKNCECPVLGICYGHQILAEIFGGKVSELKSTRNARRLHLHWIADDQSVIFSNIEELEVFVEHRDYVSKVPPGFTVLCQMDQIPYIIYQPERNLYGVQFVPEQSDDTCRELLKRFLGR